MEYFEALSVILAVIIGFFLWMTISEASSPEKSLDKKA
jgi:hypothetical protein